VVEVQQWAEIRRMKLVDGLSIRAIERRTGLHRKTIRRALASPEPPSYRSRPKRPSKLDPHRVEIERLLGDEPTLSGVRILEEIQLNGYAGGQTVLDELLRKLRPRYLPPPRSFQRTTYRPGELCQFDLTEPRREVPVGWGQTRRGWIVTAKLPYSRAFAGRFAQFLDRATDVAAFAKLTMNSRFALECGWSRAPVGDPADRQGRADRPRDRPAPGRRRLQRQALERGLLDGGGRDGRDGDQGGRDGQRGHGG